MKFDEDYPRDAVVLAEEMPDFGDDVSIGLVCGRRCVARLLSSGAEGGYEWEEAK